MIDRLHIVMLVIIDYYYYYCDGHNKVFEFSLYIIPSTIKLIAATLRVKTCTKGYVYNSIKIDYTDIPELSCIIHKRTRNDF